MTVYTQNPFIIKIIAISLVVFISMATPSHAEDSLSHLAQSKIESEPVGPPKSNPQSPMRPMPTEKQYTAPQMLAERERIRSRDIDPQKKGETNQANSLIERHIEEVFCFSLVIATIDLLIHTLTLIREIRGNKNIYRLRQSRLKRHKKRRGGNT